MTYEEILQTQTYNNEILNNDRLALVRKNLLREKMENDYDGN